MCKNFGKGARLVFLVHQFDTPNGSAIHAQHRRVSRRLRPGRRAKPVTLTGKIRSRDLIRGPDGYKMIQYMTTTPGGEELGKQLSNSLTGNGSTPPRVHTVRCYWNGCNRVHPPASKRRP